MQLLFRIEIRHALCAALRIQLNTRNVTVWADLASPRGFRKRQHGHHGRGLGPILAQEKEAEPACLARQTSVIWNGIDGHWRNLRVVAQLSSATLEQNAGRF